MGRGEVADHAQVALRVEAPTVRRRVRERADHNLGARREMAARDMHRVEIGDDRGAAPGGLDFDSAQGRRAAAPIAAAPASLSRSLRVDLEPFSALSTATLQVARI